jgi:hypothetical protein
MAKGRKTSAEPTVSALSAESSPQYRQNTKFCEAILSAALLFSKFLVFQALAVC